MLAFITSSTKATTITLAVSTACSVVNVGNPVQDASVSVVISEIRSCGHCSTVSSHVLEMNIFIERRNVRYAFPLSALLHCNASYRVRFEMYFISQRQCPGRETLISSAITKSGE
jgi:hypothetical protein